MKDNKGIAKLIAFITDIRPEEEEGKGGGDKGGEGKAGKAKAKKGSAGGKKKGGKGEEGFYFIYISHYTSEATNL